MMEKFGLYGFALLIAVSLFGIVALSAEVFAGPESFWRPAALAAVMAGPPLAFGAGWVSILWGARDAEQMVKMGVALVAHCFTGTLIAFSPYPIVVAAALAISIGADLVAVRALQRENATLA